jgi:hypothetical protein
MKYAMDNFKESIRQTTLTINLDNDVRITIDDPVVIESYCQSSIIPMNDWSKIMIGTKNTSRRDGNMIKRDNGSNMKLSLELEKPFTELV